MTQSVEANAPKPDSPAPSPDSPAGAVDEQQQIRSAMAIRLQRSAIVAHCGDMTRRLGRPVSLDEAARDWIPIYAELWRSRFEKQLAARTPEMCPSRNTPGLA